jgi:hypothetical protein
MIKLIFNNTENYNTRRIIMEGKSVNSQVIVLTGRNEYSMTAVPKRSMMVQVGDKTKKVW